jgi:hypothetical protein
MSFLSERRFLGARTLAVGAALLASPAHAFIDDIIETVQRSEFRFVRSDSEIPFVPLSWVQTRSYLSTELVGETGGPPPGTFSETAFSEGLVLPAYVSTRDMLLLGEEVLFDKLDVESGPYSDQRVVSVAPIAVWLSQLDRENLLGVFAVPLFSREVEKHDSWGAQAFAGVIVMHWKSDRFQWLYGGVYEYSFGRHYFYPYLGAIWSPSRKCSLSLVFPWPTFNYAVNDRWLLSLGVAPGGSSWQAEPDGARVVYSFVGWNLDARVAWRFYERLWLQCGAGIAGLRRITITTGESATEIKSKPTLAFSVSVQFRT